MEIELVIDEIREELIDGVESLQTLANLILSQIAITLFQSGP